MFTLSNKGFLSVLALGALMIGFAGSARAGEADTQSTTQKSYAGLGFGHSVIEGGDADEFDDAAKGTDTGWMTYGGWQFNRIVAVELVHVDYGTGHDTIDGVQIEGSQSVTGITANAGYTFDNNIRIFAQAGAGIASNEAKGSANGTTVSGHNHAFGIIYGAGAEYTPTVFANKVTFRAAYIGTVSTLDVDSDVATYADTSDELTISSGMVYAGVAYNF